MSRLPLRHWWLMLSVAALVGWSVVFAGPTQATATAGDCTVNASELAFDSSEADLWSRVNTFRAQNGRAALVQSDALNRASLWLARDAAASGYRGGVNVNGHLDSLGRYAAQRAQDCGHPNAQVDDAYDYGWPAAQYIFSDWQVSQYPYFMMLNADYNVGGVAHVQVPGSIRNHYWVLTVGAGGGSGSTPVPPTATRTTIPPTQTPFPTPRPPTSTPVPTATSVPGTLLENCFVVEGSWPGPFSLACE